MSLNSIAPLVRAKPASGLRPKCFYYHRRFIQILRADAPYLVPLVMMEVRLELAMRRKLFPKAKA
jgi:hypothetical protein